MVDYKHKSGVYVIEQIGTGRFYIGSSVDLARRFYAHRKLLNDGKHYALRLQRAWTKYGADAFTFSVLEECSAADLLVEEQAYIDVLKPVFNTAPVAGRPPGWSHWSPASQESFRKALREKAAAITCCPKGHLYDDANTYRNSKGKRLCRACNALRVSAVYARETPEQREIRRVRMAAQAQREQDREARRVYASTHKDEKRAYDVARRELANAQRRERHAQETPEQRSARLAYRREHERDTWAESNRRRRDRLKTAAYTSADLLSLPEQPEPQPRNEAPTHLGSRGILSAPRFLDTCSECWGERPCTEHLSG